MNFTEIIHNEHFNRLAIIIQIPFHSIKWRNQNPNLPFWTLWRNLNLATPIDAKFNKEDVIASFTELITRIVATETNFLFYEEADLDWFFGMLDSPEADVTLALFKAWVSASHQFVTTTQIAAATDTSDSNWRNRAAEVNGYKRIPGARKVGTSWLIPLVLLQAQGILPWDYKAQKEEDEAYETET